jgi:hypothetical protein
MLVINTSTHNEYNLVKKERYKVITSFDKSLFISNTLQSAIWQILKSERAFTIYNLSKEEINLINRKLREHNMRQNLSANESHIKSVLLNQNIKLSYYDNVLMKIHQAFLQDQPVCEFSNQEDFLVFDEITDMIKMQIENREKSYLQLTEEF